MIPALLITLFIEAKQHELIVNMHLSNTTLCSFYWYCNVNVMSEYLPWQYIIPSFKIYPKNFKYAKNETFLS